jgi:hypothetical protein
MNVMNLLMMLTMMAILLRTEVWTGKSDNALTPGRKGFFEL